METWDYIVIGAGSSGSVVAARLSEDEGARVLVLEAGPWDRSLRFKIPIAGMTMRNHPKASWQYVSEPEPGLEGRRLEVPRGRVVGGSSAINGAVYNRGNPADFSMWASAGLPDWDYASVLPYFRRIEDHWRGGDEFHGDGGPVPVSTLAHPSPLTPHALAAAREAGYPLSDDWAGPNPEGWGIPDVNVDKRGRRVTSATAFLKPALKRRRNIEIRPNATTLRLLVENGRVRGVEYERGGRVETAHARSEVVLSAGAIGSPHLLLRSGIGPADELKAAGVTPVHELKGVGRNFNDQPMFFTVRRSKLPVTIENTLRLDRLMLEMGRWLLGLGKSPLSGPPAITAANIRTVQGRSAPDLRFMLSGATHDSRPWFPLFRPGAGHLVLAMCAVAHPRSRGSITLSSADPRKPPRIRYNLLTDPWDVEEARRGYRLLAEYLAQPSLAKVLGETVWLDREVRTDEEVDAFVRRAAGTTAHPVGACRMGVDDDAVVDAQCRLRGLEGLRVVDTSVFPVQLSGNPHATAVMMGDRVSDAISGRAPLPPSGVVLRG